MKTISFLMVALLIAGCAATPSSIGSWQQEGYDRESTSIGEQVKAKKLTITQANRQMVSISKTFFPNDRMLVELWEDLAILSEQVDEKKLTFEQYDELRQTRWRLFNEANLQRHREADYLEAQRRRSEFMGNFLNNMARSMQRNNPPVINCATTSMPGVLTTNCR